MEKGTTWQYEEGCAYKYIGKDYVYFLQHKQVGTDQRAESRSKKNYNPAACGMKTTFTER